jgi:hypothetical protein
MWHFRKPAIHNYENGKSIIVENQAQHRQKETAESAVGRIGVNRLQPVRANRRIGVNRLRLVRTNPVRIQVNG